MKFEKMYHKRIISTITDILLFSEREEYKKQYGSFCRNLLSQAMDDANSFVEGYCNNGTINDLEMFSNYKLDAEDKKYIKVIADDHLDYLKIIRSDGSLKFDKNKYKAIKKIHFYYSISLRNYLFPPIKIEGKTIKEIIIYIPAFVLLNGFIKAVIISRKIDIEVINLFSIGDLFDISLKSLIDHFIYYLVYIIVLFILRKSTERADYKFIGSIESENRLRNIVFIASSLFMTVSTVLLYFQNSAFFYDFLMIAIFFWIVVILNRINGRLITLDYRQFIVFIFSFVIISNTIVDSINIINKNSNFKIILKNEKILENYIYSTSKYIIIGGDEIRLYPKDELQEIILKNEDKE